MVVVGILLRAAALCVDQSVWWLHKLGLALPGAGAGAGIPR